MIPMPAVPPAGCSGSSRYSANQTAILTPLTSVRRPHHQDTGFVQAREPDRACHSKLIRRSAVIELTFNCNNTVMCQGQSRLGYVSGRAWSGSAWVGYLPLMGEEAARRLRTMLRIAGRTMRPRTGPAFFETRRRRSVAD